MGPAPARVIRHWQRRDAAETIQHGSVSSAGRCAAAGPEPEEVELVAGSASRRPTRRSGTAIALVVVAIAAVAAGVVLQGRPAGPPGASPTGPIAASSSPPVAEAEWTDLDLAPVELAATLEPDASDDAGLQPQTAFTLSSRTGEAARSLAARLEVTPAVDLTVADGPDAATAIVRPATPLAAGTLYRFALHAADGALAGSWAFRVRGPVEVTSTIPGDATSGVPVATGIEVTFDQEGVADMADHFSIEPTVAGRFERHGRTQVFVPSGLAASTTYTVTIGKGLARTGTDLALAADVVFRFETEGPGSDVARLLFGRDVIQTGPDQRPMVAVRAIVPEAPDGTPGDPPSSARVVLYRLPSLEVAARTLADFLAAPRWTEYSDPLMPTTGLPVSARFNAKLEPLTGELSLIRFPAAPETGWYIVELAGDRPAHAFLQVTRVSAWVSTLTDRTVVWANDVVTGRAVAGATVAVGDGPVFATSGADGLAIGPTPAALVPAAIVSGKDEAAGAQPAPLLRVTSGSDVLLVPFDVGSGGDAYRGEWSEKTEPADETYWALLATDRGVYRRTDTIEAWGYLRGRDDGRVPATAQVRLVESGTGRDASAAPIASLQVTPGADGAFLASLPIREAPLGAYAVQVLVDGRVVAARWMEVTIIRKPAYQLAVTPNHLAVVVGTKVAWTTTATFFDGTPVASLDLALSSSQFDGERTVTTDAAGKVVLTVAARPADPSESGWEDPDVLAVDGRPQGPESGEIWGDGSIVVFPSALDLQATGVVAGGRLRVTGTLASVDLAKVERAIAHGTWEGDAAGAPLGGRRIQVRITELIPVREQVGFDYDFIAKEVRPVYEYHTERKAVRTLTVESAADGAILVSSAIPDATRDYEVVLTATDAAGRIQHRTITAGTAPADFWATSGIAFRTSDGRLAGAEPYGIGDRIVWRMVDDGEALPSGGPERYLYLVAQRGLRSAVVTDSSTFRRVLAEADAPGVFVIGVQFNGITYAPKAAAWANFDSAEREIRVAVSADQARYEPGGTATLSVRTTRPDGSPVSATIVIQAVDEKLYAMDGATVPTPLADLYQRVDSGILRLTATHQVPTRSGPEGEGGDATGGGPRSDFEDTILFRELRTDATGRALTTVHLSDDLTSWHVTASAVTADLEAGVGERLVPVGLPFFVEVTTADTYLLGDRPEIRVRAFGDALEAGDKVDFTVSSAALGLPSTTIHGTAFSASRIALPALVEGTPSVTVSATAPGRMDGSGVPLSDALTRTFEVVGSRLTATQTSSRLVADGLPAVPTGADRSTWTFADAGRGRLVPILAAIAQPGGVRLDRALAQSLARSVLIATFGRDPATLPPDALQKDRYLIESVHDDAGALTGAGAPLVPFGSPDPWLAARVAVLAPDDLDAHALHDVLLTIRDAPGTKRDLQIAATAGLAALGEPVLGDLQEARRQSDLTPSERLWLALGFEAAGDDVTAAALERELLNAEGERLGSWVRLRFEQTADGADATALLSVVAAGLGDPLADGLADYARENPAVDSVNALELVAEARHRIERLPAAAASFAWTVDGRRTVQTLGPGGTFSMPLTRAQAGTLAVEALSGSVIAAVEARVAVAPSTVVPHAALKLVRTEPASPIPANRVVTVNLRATFAAAAPDGCYEVVELVPSGLAPLSVGLGERGDSGVVWPDSVVGQEVRFCAFNSEETGHDVRLRYLARVVGEGTFAWEPATMELPGHPELTAITPATTVRIGAR